MWEARAREGGERGGGGGRGREEGVEDTDTGGGEEDREAWEGARVREVIR